MQVIAHFIQTYWLFLSVVAGVVVLYALIQLVAYYKYGPRDVVGNGITIGQAKAFDNRSLALRIERLSASLEQLKIVNQNVTENLSTIQKYTATQSERSVTLDLKAVPEKGEAAKKSTDKETSAGLESADAQKADSQPTVALAASDVLSEQLNLASQILNLETLYERSLTDRLINGQSRLQTVLGFQVSITPPAGCEDCVAVVEISARMQNDPTPVSLVALIPQEKTYNAQTISNSATSIGGSAVASVVTLGLGKKGESRQLFIHRDSDTIAFERNPRERPFLFDGKATVFGWEFRPVLGRGTVSAGTRQMLAVVAVPVAEDLQPNEIAIEIKSRSYWRRYNRNKQTSRRNWGWLPWRIDRSRKVNSKMQTLVVPNTARIQNDLAPKVTKITWVNSGADRATIVVEGSNFFSGTKVIMGGIVYREEDRNLTLKSNQALELETTIGSLAAGDAVLSGRFGPSFQLVVPMAAKGPLNSIYIARAALKPYRYTKSFRLTVDVKGIDQAGADQDLTIEALQNLPEPILFVGNEPVALPYDYSDVDPSRASTPESGTGSGQPASSKKYLRLEAWIPASTLARSSSVSFRIPFGGIDLQSSQPLNFSEPTVTRMGGDDESSIFRIAHPLGFSSSVSVDLDKTYAGPPELVSTSKLDFRFTVPNKVASKYQNLIVRVGDAEPYLLPLPPPDKPVLRTTIDSNGKPPQLKQGSAGPITWTGTALESIKSVQLSTNISSAKPADPAKPALPEALPAAFSVYDDGKRIDVYFQESSTNVVGRAEVELVTNANETFRLPIFISKD